MRIIIFKTTDCILPILYLISLSCSPAGEPDRPIQNESGNNQVEESLTLNPVIEPTMNNVVHKLSEKPASSPVIEATPEINMTTDSVELNNERWIKEATARFIYAVHRLIGNKAEATLFDKWNDEIILGSPGHVHKDIEITSIEPSAVILVRDRCQAAIPFLPEQYNDILKRKEIEQELLHAAEKLEDYKRRNGKYPYPLSYGNSVRIQNGSDSIQHGWLPEDFNPYSSEEQSKELPEDPFSLERMNKNLWCRYALSDSGQWILIHNGPDKKADLDITQFRKVEKYLRLVSMVQSMGRLNGRFKGSQNGDIVIWGPDNKPVVPCLFTAQEFVEYDPTNGTTSGDGIFRTGP